MEENNYLVESFSNSIGADIAEFAGEALEFTLDSCAGEDGILKDIPFVGTALKFCNIASKAHEKHSFYKLRVFINAINTGTEEPGELKKRKSKFLSNTSFRKQELEYILILIDRYIGFEKPQMLAKLYLAYLDESINWTTFVKYAECIDRFLPGDQLMLDSTEIERAKYNDNYDAVSRLEALGLIGRKVEVTPVYHEKEQNLEIKNTDEYSLTGFGWKLKQIIEDK